MEELFNAKNRTELRRGLRRDRSMIERLLWQRLRNRQVFGIKFRRQHGIGPYVVDFYAAEYRLAVEIDGGSHDGAAAVAYDDVRQRYIEQLGITVLRYSNDDVLRDVDQLAESIGSAVVRRRKIGATDHP